jgi:hypothetical protein
LFEKFEFEMAATISAATAMVATTTLSSGSSVAFNNSDSLKMKMAVSRRNARSLVIRAAGEPGTGKDERNLGDKINDAVTEVSNRIQDAMPAGTQPGGVGRKPGDEWTQYSSTGELNQSKKEAAERDNPDGLNVMDKLQDAGRTLKSKTNDVVQYGKKRNPNTTEDNAMEKNIKAQSDYTKSK